METYLPTIKEVQHILWKRDKRKRRNPEHAVQHSIPPEVDRLLSTIASKNNRRSVRNAKFKLNKILDQYQKKIDSEVAEVHEAITKQIVQMSWELSLKCTQRTTNKLTGRTRKIFSFNLNERENMVLNRIISDRLKRIFQISSPNRDRIIRATTDILQIRNLRFVVLRTDFKHFFDNVSHKKIFEKLNGHAGVPLYIKQYVTSLLEAYLTGNDSTEKRGLPTGLPISSVLAEIALEDFDNSVLSHPEVVFYSRYVDDIMIIVNTSETEDLQIALNAAAKELDLEMHSDSISEAIVKYDPQGPGQLDFGIDYLGYRFQFKNRIFKGLDISTKKRDRYIQLLRKIDARFRESQDIIAALEDIRLLLLPHVYTTTYGDWKIKGGLALSAKLILEYVSDNTKSTSDNLLMVENYAKRLILKYRAILLRHSKKRGFRKNENNFKLAFTLYDNIIHHRAVLIQPCIKNPAPERIKKVFEL